MRASENVFAHALEGNHRLSIYPNCEECSTYVEPLDATAVRFCHEAPTSFLRSLARWDGGSRAFYRMQRALGCDGCAFMSNETPRRPFVQLHHHLSYKPIKTVLIKNGRHRHRTDVHVNCVLSSYMYTAVHSDWRNYLTAVPRVTTGPFLILPRFVYTSAWSFPCFFCLYYCFEKKNSGVDFPV